jgi:polar amino acid transport system permease protein
MAVTETDETDVKPASSVTNFSTRDGFPYWLLIMLGIIGWMVLLVLTNDEYQEAFTEIIPGLGATLRLTVAAFIVSMVLGVLLGIARMSERPWVNTPATVYIEFIRGVPMIVFVFAVALMIIPESIKAFNGWFGTEIKTRSVSNIWRGGVALSLFYAAFIAEVVRAGIQSVPVGQIEAGKALGLSGRQVMRRITLPQAIRNTLPALGNDLIALMKDTSLVSVIAAAELTYNARIYQGSSFRVRETFFILMVIYVTLTLLLSLALRLIESRMETPRRLSPRERLLARGATGIFAVAVGWLFFGFPLFGIA